MQTVLGHRIYSEMADIDRRSACSRDCLILIHPPAVSKRYLRTKFMPYGMAVLYAFLKEHGVPVVQYDFLMEYLFSANNDIDYHNPERTFSDTDFFSFLAGSTAHKGLEAFSVKYGSRLPIDGAMYAFSIIAYHQFWAALVLASYIRKVNPYALIVFGGPFITIKPLRSFVPFGIADYWIRGSGEIPLLKLYEYTRGKACANRESIPGIMYVDGDRIFEGEKSTFPAEEERPPDFEGLTLSHYRYDHPVSGEQTLFLPYRISKGCPSRCSFCTGRLVDRYGVKSVNKAVNEISGLAAKYRTLTFQLADASVNGHPRQFEELCDRLSEEASRVRWYSYAKVNGFNAGMLVKAKRAGCFSLFWGVESAHEPTIRMLGKRFAVEDMYELIDESISVGIKSYIHLIYNTPHETVQDISALIHLIERYISSDLVEFLPQRFLLEGHSLMFEHPDRYGLTGIRRIESSVFEREQFIYREGALDYPDVEKRNCLHRQMLDDHIEWIRYQSMLRRSSNRVLGRIPPRLLVTSGKWARQSAVARCLHDGVVARIVTASRQIRELL